MTSPLSAAKSGYSLMASGIGLTWFFTTGGSGPGLDRFKAQ